MKQHCCEEHRRDLVAAHATLNGIDAIEVFDTEAASIGSPRQRTLFVYCLKPPPPLAAANIAISGGDRLPTIAVEWVAPALLPPASTTPAERAYFAALPQADRVLVVRTREAGDYSRYTLRLVTSNLDGAPPAPFDRRLAGIEFSFKIECPQDFDCQPAVICPAATDPPPPIDYLARDYAGYRRLLLDRIAQLVPGWRPHSPADAGVMLAELLAHVGDQLSYEQDAIATEAYLHTARRRVSVRRHTTLVDYRLHDGANARTWVTVTPSTPTAVLKPSATRFLSRVDGLAPGQLSPNTSGLDALLDDPGVAVFEPLGEKDVILHAAHERLPFYTWGDRECCLPRGATSATLAGHYPNLNAGDVLIFEEVLGPHTGVAADADPLHRQAVRLTSVVHAAGDGSPLADALVPTQAITEITWHADDALDFPLCLSSRADQAHQEQYVANVSVALGNVVLADHGRTVPDRTGQVPFAIVPKAGLAPARPRDLDRCAEWAQVAAPPRFSPAIPRQPLTHERFVMITTTTKGERISKPRPVDDTASARRAMSPALDRVMPSITLYAHPDGEPWEPRRDLLSSGRTDPHFVVEIEGTGEARLRFGDNEYGKRPAPETPFMARYRIGNGTSGNIGAGALTHIVTTEGIAAIRNPLAAAGGVNPEAADEARRRAPFAFRRQERAVTPRDYESVTERVPGVQRASARLRWTGSWHTVFIAVDSLGGRRLDEDDEATLTRHVDRFRMAGHDLEFDSAQYVSLELGIHVCVLPDHFRAHVAAAIREVLGTRRLPDGRTGLFHPDHLTFGQTLYLSPIYAAIRRVPGVQSAEIRTFQRQGTDDTSYLDHGFMSLGPLEIARLDNDPSFPEHGVLALSLGGGK